MSGSFMVGPAAKPLVLLLAEFFHLRVGLAPEQQRRGAHEQQQRSPDQNAVIFHLPFNPAGLLCFTVAGPDSLFPVTAAVEYHVIRAAAVKQINSSAPDAGPKLKDRSHAPTKLPAHFLALRPRDRAGRNGTAALAPPGESTLFSLPRPAGEAASAERRVPRFVLGRAIGTDCACKSPGPIITLAVFILFVTPITPNPDVIPEGIGLG